MLIQSTFPIWMLAIPMLGMLFVLVLMFFACRGGWKTGIASQCGCGITKDKDHHTGVQHSNERPTSNT